MTDWFDKNENKAPDPAPENSNAPSPEEPASSGWSSPSSSVVPPSSWNSASGSPDSTPAADGTPAPNNVTYRYGVHAPSPVPSNETDSARAGGSTVTPSGGYTPQGSYPYGWQQPSYPSSGTPAPGQPPKKPKKKKGAAIAIAALSVACAALIVTLSVLLAVALGDNQLPVSDNSSSSSVTNSTRDVNQNAPTLDITDPDETEGLSTRAIVQKNLDSTVVINMYTASPYYGNQLVQSGTASGIIWTTDGYIITNCHVVYNEDTGKVYDRVDVELYDGTTYEGAEIIGYDQYTDLAVIKVDATDLQAAEFGDSSQLQLGDKVVAIGNAGGLNWTVTQGIVSGLARDVYEDTGYAIKCLQVDAAINPGNSGGPLLNSLGQVVAINSAKITAEGYEGLGFSIPISEAQDILNDLVKYGYVKGRVMLGITGRSLYGTGFRIEAINSDSCLAGTEAQVGDIITAINGTQIADYEALQTELSKYSVGDTVELTLLRYDSRTHSNREFTIQCTLAEATQN